MSVVIGIDISRANVKHRTGTEWYIFNLIKQFATIIPKEYKVIVYSKEPLQDDLLPLPDHWESQVLHWPPGLLWTQIRMSLTMLRRNRPDVLFIPAHTVPLIHPKHSIYVAHDLGFERIPELYENTLIGGNLMNAIIRILTLGKYGTSELDYHRWSMQYAINHAEKIISISEFTKQELQDIYAVPEEQVAVVHNGVSTNDYRYDPELPVADKPYLLYVGRIEQKKNIPTLIDAFALAKKRYQLPHQLYLVGSSGYGIEEVEAKIAEHGLEDEVIRPGYVPQSEMNTLMNQAAAFVFPTRYEGFGIPIAEAMAAGTPIACSDIPPLHEVGGKACFYFNPTDTVDIARVLQEVTQASSEVQAAMREHGFQQLQQFSWKKCADQTWQTIESTVL